MRSVAIVAIDTPSLDRSLGNSSDELEGDSLGTLLNLLSGHDADPLESASHAEHREWLNGAMSELPEHLRVVVELIYYQGLKYREAGESLDIPARYGEESHACGNVASY